jgi:hypothetical protein
LHTVILRFGVKLAFVWGKQAIDIAITLQLFNIVLQRAWISFKIFTRGKLQPVDKNTCYDWVTVLSRKFHQCQMTLVQITHGGHKGYTQLSAQLVTQFLDSMNNLQFFVSVSRPSAI